MKLPAETEYVEFKEAKSSYDSRKLGKYFSALSNEANLKGQPEGWLIFGIKDNPRRIVGTQYRRSRTDLDSLKKDIADKTTNRLTFVEIHELILPEGRVLMFQIPPSPRGIPTAWGGHYWGRDGESLVPLNFHESDQIRGQSTQDWSAIICPNITLDSLDPQAVATARQRYKERNPRHEAEVDCWDDRTFLNKAKVLRDGQVTNAAIVLLGREDAEHHISPAMARISWVLRGADGSTEDYKHFGPPLLLHADAVYRHIRNLPYRYLKNDSLFPTEITRYEPWVIREALHNCIAHQDYSLNARITVVEGPDSLLLTNSGSFIPQTVERVIEMDAPPQIYRNPFLASAMVSLNMIDTVGSGIRRMFMLQRERFFPLPDYDLSEPNRVAVKIFGKVLDENYTRLLMTEPDLGLSEVMALDKVQKRRVLSETEFRQMKSRQLIEGRRPNLYVAARIAAATGQRAAYIRNRALDKDFYKKMVLRYIEEYGSATRKDLDALLLNKISDALTISQKKNKVRNLLQEMARRDGTIQAEGPHKFARWSLAKKHE